VAEADRPGALNLLVMRPAQGWGFLYGITIGGGSAGKDLRGRG